MILTILRRYRQWSVVKTRKRVYDALLIEHLARYRQMVLISKLL
jgi:hypothetical protein